MGGLRLSSVCTKLQLARSKCSDILEIHVLQKFTPHAFYPQCQVLAKLDNIAYLATSHGIWT